MPCSSIRTCPTVPEPRRSSAPSIGRPSFPVVLTATSDSEAALSAVQHGAQDYLVKSETDGKVLSRALRYAIERAGIQAELLKREHYFRALIERA
jgi:DNA-binding NarL/FixJ family response regulator